MTNADDGTSSVRCRVAAGQVHADDHALRIVVVASERSAVRGDGRGHDGETDAVAVDRLMFT